MAAKRLAASASWRSKLVTSRNIEISGAWRWRRIIEKSAGDIK